MRLPVDDEARACRRHTAWVLGIALTLRVLVLWTAAHHYPPQWFYTRGMEMGLLAKSVVEGHGLASPFGPPTGPTAFIAPAYPLLVALVFRIFGVYSTASAIVIEAAQTILNLATIVLLMNVARRLFSERAAVIAGAIWACSLPLIWMPTIFWETSLSTCLLTAWIALTLHWRAQPESLWTWPVLGALAGVTALVNPALLLTIVAIMAWFWWPRRRTSGVRPVLAVLVFTMVFAAWPIRNERVFHAFIPLRTTVGMELWMGNHAGATGFLDESLFPTFNGAELAAYKRDGEVAYCNGKQRLALDYIAANPGWFLRLSAVRTVRFWTGTGSHGGSALFAAHACFTTLFGFAGLWMLYRSRRRAEALLFALPLALFPLPYMITHAEFRYRLVLDPLLTITAGHALAALSRRFSASPQTLGQRELSLAGTQVDSL